MWAGVVKKVAVCGLKECLVQTYLPLPLSITQPLKCPLSRVAICDVGHHECQ
jgi:hypothetical protein